MGFNNDSDASKNISQICILDGDEKKLYEVAADVKINGERVLLIIMDKDFDYSYIAAARYNDENGTLEFFSEEDTQKIIEIFQQEYNIIA